MRWYFYIALAAIVSQLVFLTQMYRNYRYALSKYKRKRLSYQPKVVLIVPCEGLDQDFTKNITSLFNQDYKNYLLWFVVADESDPAYAELFKLKDSLTQASRVQDVRIHVAGLAQSCGQKNHNLLHCYRKISDDVEVMAFADSDIRVNSDWLSYLVYPLRKPKNGVASGYRWFVPQKNNLATLALSAVNAKIAQLLGSTRFNQAWGGSMAVRVDVFRRLGIDKIWANSLSDDLSLSTTVKKAGLKVIFVPACLVASYESTTWRQLFEFGRRQFLITRVNAPKIWWFGLFSSLYSILGLWAGAALAIYAAGIADKNLPLFAAVPILFFTSQLIRAILRQKMIGKLLESDAAKMEAVAVADVFFFWVWSFLLLFFIISSVFGRTIRWR
ncbi:MAG: glycosyltransferase family 2 protein [Sedimentisphaerales bacterium]|nr:glycosyltransferase family 2 protein [Sedimentisphaerales bacterium]